MTMKHRPQKRKRLGQSLRFETLEERRLLANVPAGYTESVLAANLTSPTTLDIEDSGRVWVAYQDGRIEVIEPGVPGTSLAHQLDADGSAEHGLQGLELDPDFENNHYLYVYYTANSPTPHNRLSRLTVDATTENTIIPGSELVLLDLPNLSDYGNPPWHIGGAVHFGLDGSLYVQIGESQQTVLAQDLESPLGKVLRVDPSTGDALVDNPFYDAGDGITWQDYIWATGLRNPFAGDLNPITGQYLIADVGQGSWEEINDATLPGLNFGWPATEGNFNQQTFPDYTQPLHAYSHAAGCAITGGAFNIGGTTPFAPEFEGYFFFSEFCGSEIRVIDPSNAASSQVFATDAAFPMNIEFGPEGSLYYISRGAGAGGAPGIGTGSVRRIDYELNSAPQIVIPPADQLVSIGYDATFSVEAAGTAPLEYQWQLSTGGPFTDIADATEPTLALTNVQLADAGKQYRVVVTNLLGTEISTAATLNVTSDTPPTPVISQPTAGTTYRAGDTITFGGSASDLEDGPLSADGLTWRVDFHHNVHSHPFIPPTSGITGGQFTIPVATETDHDVWYRINLSATDSAGLVSSTFFDVFPEKSDFVVETNLPDNNGSITVDSHVVDAPFATTGVENVQRTFEVPSAQRIGAETVYFMQWLDGETELNRTVSTPQEDTAYVALYQSLSTAGVYVSDLTPVGTPTNSWGPIEFDTSNGEDEPGDGNPMTLNGVVYAKGLGVHAYSEVTYDLDGAYSRFVSDIGVDDETGSGGSVVFRVLADGNEVFNSGLMTGDSTTQTVNVEMLGVNELKLIVEEGGDGNGFDHANWADARLLIDESVPLVDVNFQLDGVPIPAGYLEDTGQIFGDRGNGWNYGWSSDHTDVSRDRDINALQRFDTLLHFHAAQSWEIEIPNGTYAVEVSIGDAEFASTHTLNVEGINYWDALPLTANNFATQTLIVTVNDGRLTLDPGAAADKETRINYVQISSISTESSLLPFTAADVNLDSKLDLNDVVEFGAGWGLDGSTLTLEQRVRQGDLDFDGDTDIDDWDLFNARWLQEGNAPLSFSSVITPLPGDYDRNGTVDGADLAVWDADYSSTSKLAADGSGNSTVDGSDFLIWQRNLGATEGSETQIAEVTAATEPASQPQSSNAAAQLSPTLEDSLTPASNSVDSPLLPTAATWWTQSVSSLSEQSAETEHSLLTGASSRGESTNENESATSMRNSTFATTDHAANRENFRPTSRQIARSSSQDAVSKTESLDLAFGQLALDLDSGL